MSGLAGSASSPLSPKAAHYSSALSAALLHGAWADGHAGKDAKGHEVSWGELVRKWGKHTGGNTSLVHHLRDISLVYLSAHSTIQTSASGYITVSTPPASRGQPLPSVAGDGNADGPHSSTSSSAETGENSHSGSGSSFVHVPHPQLRRHKSQPSLDATSRAVTSGSGPSIGGNTVRQADKAAYLSNRDLDGDEGEGEEYWAEGAGWWNGVGLDQVDEVRDGIRKLEEDIKGGKYKENEAQTARLTLAYHFHAIGDHERALQEYEKLDWSVDANAGEAAVLDRIRGRCLQGMSYELLNPSSPTALQSYIAIFPLLTTIFPLPLPAYLSTSSTTPVNRITFEPNRELHRWLSTALCRAAIISSRQQNSLPQTLRILRTYHAFAASWPSSFRPNQRHRMLLLYLTALATGLPEPHVPAESPYLLVGGETSSTAHHLWRQEAILAIRDGQRLLLQTTNFPRAGEVNKPVSDFTELCVALADRSPNLTLTVIEVLWWSMTLTFQSQSVLRHLTRLLQRKDQFTDAKRTFELYVQLVLKSRETAQPESSLQLEDAPTDEFQIESALDTDEEATTSVAGQEAQGLESEELNAEIDGDREFIEALLVGTRLLSKDLGELEEAWRYACLAREAVNKVERGSIGTETRARVEEVLGIIRMAMATAGADPVSRPIYQAQAINHLLLASKMDPSSSEILYHLSFAQAEARSIDDATQSIHTSLELDSGNVQAWHLLALLLTAKQDWDGARKACEAGVAVWEADEATDATAEDDEESENGEGADVGVESRDFAVSQSRATTDMSSSLSMAPPLLRPSGSLLPLSPAPPLAAPRSRRLQNVIRLRMTLIVITEKTQGPGMAMLYQQELFAFFSARSGEDRRQFGYGTGGIRTLPSMSTVGGLGGLGGSYVSVLGGEGPGNSVINVHPPTPSLSQGYTMDNAPRITHSTAPSSPGNSTPTDDGAAIDTLSRDFADQGSIREKSADLDGRESMTPSSKKSLAKHLHLPGGRSNKGRPSSVRTGVSGLPNRNRTASNSSTALSVSPSAAQSHFRGAGSASLRPTPAPSIMTTDPTHGRTPGESRTLSNLWLMSAATFRRWGKMEQYLVAINEAEVLDPENGDVWIQLGLYHSATVPPNTQAAQSAYTKAILLRPLHPAALVHLSELYLRAGQADLAHGFLNQITQDNGWDMPEAWVLLARVCKSQGREARERECLLYALLLEETKGARAWRDAVDRWL